MKKKKELLVDDVLEKMPDSARVVCVFYAFGIYYGDTQRDSMNTVKQCKENMNYDCKKALITKIEASQDAVHICAEIVH